ncbi:MAG: DUF4238 domain-containing protein [Phycisphaeraceae bacterium]|nr:DUF4238 domain-containing protein [Phycisphaeraceae bacterium]
MTPKSKKHHYVPQYLLRHFAVLQGGNPYVWVLDKRDGRVRRSSIREVAHENAYNAILNHKGEPLSFEPLLAKIDDIGARIIAEINRTGRIPLAGQDRVWLSYVMASQLLRAPRVRSDDHELLQRLIQRAGPDARFEGDEQRIGDITAEDIKASCLVGLQEEVPSIAKLLQRLQWFLSQGPTSAPFLISDSPIAFSNMFPRPGRGTLGLKVPGIEVHFPISPRYVLHLICPELTKAALVTLPNRHEFVQGLREGTSTSMQAENVTFTNSLQVIEAHRWVFGRSRADLDLALDMLRTSPELANGLTNFADGGAASSAAT